MHITIVPCRSDNYAYLVRAPDQSRALCVDPAAAAPVQRALRQANLALAAILTTHHHYDHTGGNEALAAQFDGLRRLGYGPGYTDPVQDGTEVTVAGLQVKALHVPGHTRDGIAYLIGDAVFTGDTLFVAGCGRLFEGTAEQMHDSLQKLARLPEATRVYCGHEYTVENLRFAARVEPDNADVRVKLEQAIATRKRGEPTVPSSIGEELRTNPFLRTDREGFATVRAAKDRF